MKNFADLSCIFCGEKISVDDELCSKCVNPVQVSDDIIGKNIL